VTHEDLWLARHHKTVRKAMERCLNASDQPASRWHVIDGADEDYREVRVGEILRDEMLAGLQHTQKAVRARTTRVSKSQSLPRVASARSRTTTTIASSNNCRATWRCMTRHARFRKRGLVLAFEGMDAAGKGGCDQPHHAALDARQYQVVPVSAPTRKERSYPYSVALLARRAGARSHRNLRSHLVRPRAGRARARLCSPAGLAARL
jgi:polyphosphate kinase 2 (PPK2 family)